MLGVLATLCLHRAVNDVQATVHEGGDVDRALDALRAQIDGLSDVPLPTRRRAPCPTVAPTAATAAR